MYTYVHIVYIAGYTNLLAGYPQSIPVTEEGSSATPSFPAFLRG